MSEPQRVHVEWPKNGGYYVCRPDKQGWRCGRCLRGLVRAKVGARCKVCRSRVYRVGSQSLTGTTTQETEQP